MPSYIEPAGFILIRIVVSVVLFILFAAVFSRGVKIEKKDYRLLFLCGLFGVAINQLLFFEGLARTSAVNASLIISTNPVLVLLAASYFLKDQISARRIAGISMGVAGAALLILTEKRVPGVESSWIGDALIFVNAASYALFLVMVKPLMQKYPPAVVMSWTFFFGMLLTIPFGYKQVGLVDWQSFSTGVWLAVAYICVCSTFLAYLLNVYGLKQLSPAVLSFYIYVQPLFATAISVLLSGEPVTWVQVVSCLLIFAGVWFVGERPLAKEKS